MSILPRLLQNRLFAAISLAAVLLAARGSTLSNELLNIVTVAGRTADIGDGRPAVAAQLNLPAAVANDAAGNHYIAEGSGHRVRKVDVAGTITTFAGTGAAGYNGDNIPAITAQLNFPRGVVVDSTGNLLIVENGGHRVRKVNLASGVITTVVGTGIAGSSGDGGPALAAQLNGPGFATVDAAGNLYISELIGNRIRVVDTAGEIATFAGTGVLGSAGDGGSAALAQFRNPNALSMDSASNLYVADVNNNRIRKINAITRIITTIAGTGVAGFFGDGGLATAAQLNAPRTVTSDWAGNLYIADFVNNRVRRVDAYSGIITTYAGTGARGFSGDGGLAIAAELNGPNGVNIDAVGSLYISESLGHRVRRVDPFTGTINTFAGGALPQLGDGGPALAAQFDPSSGVAFDVTGNLLIADLNNNRIRHVNGTGIITTIAGTGPTASTGDGGPASNAQLNGPFAIAVDPWGDIYIAESTGRRIRKIDAATGVISSYAGTGVSGSTGDGGLATGAQINNPQGVATDGDGNLYISEFAGFRVRKVNRQTGIISRFAGTGLSGFDLDNVTATTARLNSPQGLAVDTSGKLFIADLSNRRIRVVNLAGIISTIAGNGLPGFFGDGESATAAQLDAPNTVAVDASGNLYIADSGNHRIRKVDPSGIITTIAGSGVAGFAGDGGAATAAKLNGARGVALDAAGNIYITDSANTRIRRLNIATKDVAIDINEHGNGEIVVRAELYDARDLKTLANVTLRVIDAEGQSTSNAFPAIDIVAAGTNSRKAVFRFASNPALKAGQSFRLEGIFATDGRTWSGDAQIRSAGASNGTPQ